MRYIRSLHSIEGFLWETKKYINSLKHLGVKPKNIIILTTNDDCSVVREFNKLDDLNIHLGKLSDMYTAYINCALYGIDK